MAEAGFTILLMAIVPIIIKGLSANPYTIGLCRLGMAIVFGFFVLRVPRYAGQLSAKQWGVLALIGIIFGAHWLTYFIAIKTATPSIAVLGTSSYGIHLIGLGWLFLGRKPGPIDAVAVTLAVIGNLLVIPEFSLANSTTPGLLWGILSGFLFALLPILHQRNSTIPNNLRAFGQFLFALPVFLIFLPQANWDLSAMEWGGMVYLGLGGTLLAHSLWVRVTTRLNPAVSSLVLYMLTPTTMLLSFLFLDEAMPWQKLAGAALIVGANLSGIIARWRKGSLG